MIFFKIHIKGSSTEMFACMHAHIYGSIIPGREFGAYFSPYFVGENSTPVSIIFGLNKVSKSMLDR